MKVYRLTILTISTALTCCGPCPADEPGIESKVIPAGNIPVSVRPGLLGDSGTAATDVAKTDGSNVTADFGPNAGLVEADSGVATNLTVSDTLVVTGVVAATSGTISGTDAGDYAGEYTYKETDATYGHVFTNSNGRFLFDDADYWIGGEYALGSAVGTAVYANSGSTWHDLDYNPVDITLTGTPDFGEIRGDINTMGDVNVGGNILSVGGTGTFSATSALNNTLASINTKGTVVVDGAEASSIRVESKDARDVILLNAQPGQGVKSSMMNILTYAGSEVSFWENGCLSGLCYAYAGRVSVTNTYFGKGFFYMGTNNGDVLFSNPTSPQRLEKSLLILHANGPGKSITGGGHMVGNVVVAEADSYSTLVLTNLTRSVVVTDGGYYEGKGLFSVGQNNTQTNDYTAVVGQGVTTWRSDAMYSKAFIASDDGSTSTTNNRFYFGSDSWIFVDGTNLMFRNSSGNIGTVDVTY